MRYSGSRRKRALALCLLAAAQLAAQRTQLDFENDQVIINEPHPGTEIPGFPRKMHDHKLNRVMVYMHPGGERLHYQEGNTVDLKWHEGEVKWSPASGLHYSEIPSANPVFPGPMIVDIGIKKSGDSNKTVSSALDPVRVDPRHFALEFENRQVRVLRLKLAPRESTPIHEYVLNRLVVPITDQNVRQTSPYGKSEVRQNKAAEFSWVGPSKQKMENLSAQPFEAVIVEFKN